MNTFLNELKNNTNIIDTENGGVAHKTTNSKVLDMFALGGSYRCRSDEDVILLFKNAYEEDPLLAMKCLFYLRDIRGGQGERRFFRVVFKWLCKNFPLIAKKNLLNVVNCGRWDDLIYTAIGTPCERECISIIKHQLALDAKCKTPSLLAKWMPSQNASNKETKRLGHILANRLGLTNEEYRKLLSALREKIKIVECLMSAGRWNEIEFDKIPSKAGLIYRNAFARRDVLAQKYIAFMEDSAKKVNAKTLYPKDIAHKAFDRSMRNAPYDSPERLALQKYWDNLLNYYGNRQENGIAIVDTSGSMGGTPLEAAVSLGAYIAEKAKGPFANHFITFSSAPRLVEFKGIDIVDKFNRCKNADWGMNTNIEAVFNLLLNMAKSKNVKKEDMPTRLYIFSDMEFDRCMTFAPSYSMEFPWASARTSHRVVESELERIKKLWELEGYDMPQVIFWNLSARQDNIPAIGTGFTYISGFSPVMIQIILEGKSGYDLMLEKLLSERYKAVVI